jgi:hypothetical protein
MRVFPFLVVVYVSLRLHSFLFLLPFLELDNDGSIAHFSNLGFKNCCHLLLVASLSIISLVGVGAARGALGRVLVFVQVNLHLSLSPTNVCIN